MRKCTHDAPRAGIFNPRSAGRLRPSGEFCAAREGYFTKYNALRILNLESLDHDTEGKRFKFPHPLLWRNEASLLDQWRTMYFPIALFAYTVCCRRTEQCFSVLRTHKSDLVDGSSGRRYVTDQWHNVPLLRARALDTAWLQDKNFIAHSKILNNYPKL